MDVQKNKLSEIHMHLLRYAVWIFSEKISSNSADKTKYIQDSVSVLIL
jgi:hypothetical protein